MDLTELDEVLAKSATGSGTGVPELLTDHSNAVRGAALEVADRIGLAGLLASEPAFWTWAVTAGLLHDAGKVAEGFQRQLKVKKARWRERHEVLSLAYVDLLAGGLPPRDRLMVATGVAFHHRSLTVSGGLRRSLADEYPQNAAWEKKFGRDPDADKGEPRIQVPVARHRDLLAWLAGELGAEPAEPDGRRLWERARDIFAEVEAAWTDPVAPELGLVAVLLQGAVTLADHSGSAHVPLQRHMPLPRRYLDRLAAPYAHQRKAATVTGHLVLTAPTGSGKTEAGLAWASTQLETMPGRPRLVWVLPYRASIDAAVDRFKADLDAAPGETSPDVGVLHSTAAQSLLTRAVAEDCAPSAQDARKARARAGAMRLFAQRVRVATPHQLLRAAIAGPRYSSVLLEQANALVVLDELHAYDPETFGRICAALRLWNELGSRTAVLSATLAPPMVCLVQDSVGGTAAVVHAAAGTAPDRHRLVLDDQPLTSPESLERLTSWLGERRSVLVVANPVATAQRLFELLAPAAREACPGDPESAMLLHSRFKARDRAAIEKRVLARHPERRPGQAALRGGGLVVSTQVLEVSLRLDFDRGAVELAPIESVAQRAGRVNRRGLHPDGVVEFRVHPPDSPLPYEQETLDAAWDAMRRTTEHTSAISEETVETWLADVYDTPWGRRWASTAKQARDDFTASFLTFDRPFDDRSEFITKNLDKDFDTVHVLHADDVDEYRTLSNTTDGDPLLAEGLLVPISFRTRHLLRGRGLATAERGVPVQVVNAPYDNTTGLNVPAGKPADAAGLAPRETIL